ncbi:MAG: SCO family protein [Candidatus Tectomicrobia bacterium]|nr:SCO family protein [Candidatus Tectomicrobia bacterium]
MTHLANKKMIVAALIMALIFSGGGVAEAHFPDWVAHLVERLFGIEGTDGSPSPGWLPPKSTPSFSLSDQDGHLVATEGLRGKVVLIYFLSSQCEGPCLTTLKDLKVLGRVLGNRMGREVEFLGITLTPERDSPEILKRFARDMGIDVPGWRILTGPPQTIKDLIDAYGVYAAPAEYLPVVLFIDQKGKLRKRMAPDLVKVWGQQDIKWLIEEKVQ